MGYLFRINKGATGTNNTIVDWSNTTRSPYDHGVVDKIGDSTTTQREITSIPSPFARIELVKEAFGKIINGSINNLSQAEVLEMLHGGTIYHKMVSDSLDIGQIFFNYPSMKDKVEIKVWNRDNIEELIQSRNISHQVYGKSLKMFFDQDSRGSDPYNFGKMKNIYILKYIGPGQKSNHIIGATSPATLFFSTANPESEISSHLCFGEDLALDDKYASLDQRDPDYLKYIFTLRYSIQNFSVDFPEVDSYLEAIYYVLDDGLKAEINRIQKDCTNIVDGARYIDTTYRKLNVTITSTEEKEVEVNGFPLHYKVVNLQGNTDFEIRATKKILGGKTPLVLPVTTSSRYENLEYYSGKFGRSFTIPYYDARELTSRTLPGINIQHPYLTISDFLDDKIIMLCNEFNGEDFFDGNFTSTSEKKSGYLLPVKKLFFDYFTTDDLRGATLSGKHFIDIKELSSGVEVALRIPIANGDVEYKRIYTLDVKADQQNNTGAIVTLPEDFNIGVFPPVKFNNEADAQYRIAIVSDFNLNKECSCICHNNNDAFYKPDYVVRNVDIEGDLRSKVYILENQTFDCALISILTDVPGKEMRATGLMVPRFRQRAGASNLTFAIDLGTSNTHIEYTSDNMPKPFSYSQKEPLFSLISKPSDLIRLHVSGEFLPKALGNGEQCHFPTRTVLCIDRNNSGINESGKGSYVALGNASPAFMYNKAVIGPAYNDYIPNLKWSQLSNDNEERISCYIESLFLMIRAKVIREGASLTQTQIKWFYPISMSTHKLGLFQRVWTAAYQKYFNPNGQPIAITESIAPYSFFQKTRADVTNIVTIDIGGGTTDIVVADSNEVKLVTSMRFAADTIFSNSLVAVQDGPLNGIIKQFKDQFIDGLDGDDDMIDLQKMLKEMTKDNLGNSSEVASFLFSLEDNELIRQHHLQKALSFNEALIKDNSQKIVFYIFFTAIIYHLAHLMKAKGLAVPTNIAFSGNGSKIISVLSTVTASLEKLTTKIFSLVYNADITDISMIINCKNPKEATCKGGLFLTQVPDNVSNAKSVLLGTKQTTLVESQRYSEAESFYKDIVAEVKSFCDSIVLRIPDSISLKKEFEIDNKSLELAKECFNKNLKTYLEKGVKLKLDSKDVSKDDVIEETLFFYPIIGVLNDLSEKIYRNQMTTA